MSSAPDHRALAARLLSLGAQQLEFAGPLPGGAQGHPDYMAEGTLCNALANTHLVLAAQLEEQARHDRNRRCEARRTGGPPARCDRDAGHLGRHHYTEQATA